ncbi:outer membrane protein assembly factor BamE [Cellvibrio sp.]|uniref:outer membrane protein assembly factor BamE n=1 Tax=Cellvibrio sp. TaxID=1965322 RepID=UPI0039648985
MKLASRILLVTLCALSLTSCSLFPSVHKLNIQQGHIITADMVNQLKLGMSKRQVRFVLGNTLLPDTFNDNRWDYFYSVKVGRTGEYVKHLFTVYFENDKLVKTEGDYLPGKAPLSEDKSEKYLDNVRRDIPLPTNIEKKPEPVIDQPK